MTNRTTLLVSAFGDPWDPGTFSGTARNFMDALQRSGQVLSAVNSERPDVTGWTLTHAVVQRLSKRLYSKHHYDYKGLLLRRLRGAFVSRVAHRENVGTVLHITPLSMPVPPSRRLRHLLFIDSTWHTWSRFSTNAASYSPRLARDIERADRLSLHQADHVFTTASYVREDVIEHYGIPCGRVTAVGTGLGSSSPKLSEPKDYGRRSILFVAKTRFSEKGRDLLLDAYRRVVGRLADARLVVAGDPSFRPPPDLPGVVSHGFTTTDELQRLFHDASLFVLPAVNEPWGLVYLEAMASATPIVGLLRNAIPEFIGDGAFGFGIGQPDPVALGELLVTLLSDPDRLQRVGLRARAHCLATYSWDRVASAVVDRLRAPDAPGSENA